MAKTYYEMTAMPITFCGKSINAPTDVLTADQFRESANVPADMKLWRQNRAGFGDDELIEGPAIVSFEAGDVLYTTPRSI